MRKETIKFLKNQNELINDAISLGSDEDGKITFRFTFEELKNQQIAISEAIEDSEMLETIKKLTKHELNNFKHILNLNEIFENYSNDIVRCRAEVDEYFEKNEGDMKK